MGRYVARRLLQMIPVFIGATLLIFLMVNVMGDPVAGLCGERACDPATAAQLKREFGLDQPLWRQYATYMGNVFAGDFGTAFNGQPVTELMAAAFPVTVRLTVVAVLFEIVIGIALGVVTGLRRGRPVDTGRAAGHPGRHLPAHLRHRTAAATAARRGVGLDQTVRLAGRRLRRADRARLVLASVSLAYVTRLTRTSIAENKRSDYVRTAIAKGLPRRRVISRHLLRNSLIPVVTFIGTDIGALMGGAIVTERIFNIHGVGYQLYQGILRRTRRPSSAS